MKLPAKSRSDVGGDLYEVEPLGPVGPDPDEGTPGLSQRTTMAKVVRVIERKVRLDEREVDALMTRAIESLVADS